MQRFWIDANIVLRLLTDDPKDQAEKVQRIMERAQRGEIELILNPTVVAEILWTLRSVYQFSMREIGAQLIPFLSAEHLQVQERELLISAIELSMDKNVDFLDAYLALHAMEQGDRVLTFHQADFRKLPAQWSVPE